MLDLGSGACEAARNAATCQAHGIAILGEVAKTHVHMQELRFWFWNGFWDRRGPAKPARINP